MALLAVALASLPQVVLATANYVYHERTTADPGCGGQYVTTLYPTSAQTHPLRWKIEYQFYTTDTRVYYTTNGAAPSGAFGVPSGSTLTVTGAYTCTFGGPVVDVASATIPAQPEGTVVKYIISAWHSGGGAEIFANSGEFSSPFTTSAAATLFQYTVGSTTSLYWDSNGTTAGAGALPIGSWGTSTFWSSTFDGSSPTTAWVAGRNAIFSAGTDATASNNIPLVGNQTAGSLTIEDGHISLLASNQVVLGTGSVNINNGATLTVDTSARFSQAVGSTWNFNGGTLRNQNPSSAGSFVPVAASVVLGASGGTFNQPVTNILSIVESSNVISGVGGVTKTGIGVLAFAGTNTYSGPTIINDGELRMRTTGGPSRLPSNTVVTIGATGILNLNGVPTTVGSLSGSGRVGFSATTLAINGTTDSIWSGTLTNQANYGASGAASGAGRISKGGSSTLTITGTNLITGSITNFAGSINLATNAVLCDTTCDITIQGGFLNLSNALQNILSLRGTNSGTVNLGGGHTLMIGGSSTHTFCGSITGPGTLVRTNFTGAWILTNGPAPSTYTGQTQIRGGIIQVSSPAALGATNGNTDISIGGELRFDGAFTTFTNPEPLSIAGPGASGGGAITIQNAAAPTLTGPITLTGDAYITISSSASGIFQGNITAAANQNLFLAGSANSAGIKLISGNINLGSGGIIKTNTGEWILSGSNTLSGGTVVLAGTLQASNTTGSATGSGLLTVSNGASLTGNGIILGPVVVNGTLSPGFTNIASLTLDDNVTLSAATSTRIDINKSLSPKSDRILAMNTFTAGGSLIATNAPGAPVLAAGDSIPVFTATTYAGSFASITPTIPGAGLAWDLPALNTTGNLIVHSNPVANADSASAQHGQTTTLPVVKLLSNDTGELGETLSVTAVSVNASLGGGLVTYTAPLTGTSDVITYTLSDGRGGTNTGTIAVTLSSSGGSFNQISATSGGGFAYLTYLGIPGTNYALDWATNLTAPITWKGIATNAAGASGSINFTNLISLPPTNDFYRTRYVP